MMLNQQDVDPLCEALRNALPCHLHTFDYLAVCTICRETRCLECVLGCDCEASDADRSY